MGDIEIIKNLINEKEVPEYKKYLLSIMRIIISRRLVSF